MTRYSPSSRVDYNFCPRYWWLRKRWQSRSVEYPELCAMAGTAVSEAQAHWNRCRMQSKPVTVDELIALGLQSFTMQLANETALDRRVGFQASSGRDKLPRMIETGIRLLWDENPLEHMTILEVEQEYPDYGKARLDVLVQSVTGEKSVRDYKCKFGKLDTHYHAEALQEYLDHEQGLVYTHMTGTQTFGIILVALNVHTNQKPHKPMIYSAVKTITPDQHRIWERDATMDYNEMIEIESLTDPRRVRGKAYPHTTRYGDCPFKSACLEDDLDESKMLVRYMKREGKDAVSSAGK